MMHLQITWHDGATDVAPNADAMLLRLAGKQMDDDVDIARALAKRAFYWSNGDVSIDPESDDPMTILESMLAAGMLTAIDLVPAAA